MKLIRKWNPASAPVIENTYGAAPFRVIAMIRDDLYTTYICFFDSYTGKVYVEVAEISNTGSQKVSNSNLCQIKDDKEWGAIIEFLQRDDVQVLQMVEEGFSVDKNTKKLTIHTGLSSLPRVPYGVDSNGSQLITRSTPIASQISPSLLNEDGSLINF